MVATGTTAIVGSRHIHNTFLLLTGVFNLYMAGFGYRSLFLKVVCLGRAGSAVQLGGGGRGAGRIPGHGNVCVRGRKRARGRVWSAGRDDTALCQLRGYAQAGHWTKNQWLLNHISGFLASYIAAVSAFPVTSLHFIPFPSNFL